MRLGALSSFMPVGKDKDDLLKANRVIEDKLHQVVARCHVTKYEAMFCSIYKTTIGDDGKRMAKVSKQHAHFVRHKVDSRLVHPRIWAATLGMLKVE
eukprot:7279433-Lingulodinium_polyedra.AAC.1